MLTGIENSGDMQEILSDSTELDSEFDIIAELKDTFNELSDNNRKADADGFKETALYLGFLIRSLEDTFTGEYEKLRYQRFIIKKTPA